MKKDSISQILVIILAVCLVCSIVVSAAAVALRDLQDINSELARKKNILIAANVIESTAPAARVNELFNSAELRLVDLDTGQFIETIPNTNIDAATYDQRLAEKDPALSAALSVDEDIASISRRERYSLIYYIGDQSTQANSRIAIFPIRGYGLWSTLRGYLALDATDYNNIVGITFYEHAETPGLGGEVDNEAWKASWRGKKLYDDGGMLAMQLVRGGATAAAADYQVDALSGATITSNGVNNLLRFWFGSSGFGKFIENQNA